MNKDDYVVLKHIVDLIPTLDLSDDNNYTFGLFPRNVKLSVFTVGSNIHRNTYVGYNDAGAIIFSTIEKSWCASFLAPIANYGSRPIKDEVVYKMKGELYGLYLVKLDAHRRSALIKLIEKYKTIQKRERAKTADHALAHGILEILRRQLNEYDIRKRWQLR